MKRQYRLILGHRDAGCVVTYSSFDAARESADMLGMRGRPFFIFYRHRRGKDELIADGIVGEPGLKHEFRNPGEHGRAAEVESQ